MDIGEPPAVSAAVHSLATHHPQYLPSTSDLVDIQHQNNPQEKAESFPLSQGSKSRIVKSSASYPSGLSVSVWFLVRIN